MRSGGILGLLRGRVGLVEEPNIGEAAWEEYLVELTVGHD